MKKLVFAFFASVVACSSSSSSPGISGDDGGGGADVSASDGASADASADGSTSSDSSTSDSGGTTAQAACAALADAVCAKLQSCAPFAVGATYGDAATCKARVALTCVPAFGATGTSATPAKTAACAQSVSGLACAAFLANQLGAACAVAPGTVASGGACGDDAQCASTFCARAPDAACGTCAAPTAAGDACVHGACSTGTVCPAGQTKCIAPGTGQVGDACTVQENCDLARGVGCNTQSGKCLALTLATSTCGASSITPTSYAVCPASGTCSAVFGGTCAAAAADGHACSASATGAHCVPPAKCIGGTCAVPDATTCH